MLSLLESYRIRTSLSPQEVCTRIEAVTDTTTAFFFSPHYEFRGRVSEDGFRLVQQHGFMSRERAVCRGRIYPRNGGALIVLARAWWSLAFCAFCLTFFAAVALTCGWPFVLPALLGAVAACLLVMVYTGQQRQAFVDWLCALVDGRLLDRQKQRGFSR